MKIIRSLALVAGLVAAFKRRKSHRNTALRQARVEPVARFSPQSRRSEVRPQGKLALLRQTVKQFREDDCTTMGAALAYYTTFSIAPLLLVVIAVAGIFLEREAVEGQLYGQIRGLVGSPAAEQVSTIVRNASQDKSTGVLGSVIGLLAVLFGATTAFAQLQAALNRAWQVKPDPKAGGIRNFITKRLLSLGMVLSIGFLLLVSLILSAAISGLNAWAGSMLPEFLSEGILQGIHAVTSLALITLLFAAIFKVLPDSKIQWRDVWVGAALTALLFTVGKFLIGLYLGQSSTASTYGAAGSLIIIILWVYYASLILLMGAEFTQVWAESRGRAIHPEEGAARVTEFPLRRPA